MNLPLRPLTADVHTDERSAFPVKAFSALWMAFCLLMICASLQDALRNPVIRWWEPVLWEGSSALVATVWITIAISVRGRYASYLDRPLVWLGHYLQWLPLVFVTFITAVYAIRHGVYALVGRSYEHSGWWFLFAYESVKLSLFAGLWLGILFGIDSYGQWRLHRDRWLQTRKALAEAQLAQLQGQLRPHFLFNALNTVSALMHTDVARADTLIATLGDLLRISLRSIEHEMTPLQEELRTLALYANIMRERFRDRVTLAWQTDQAPLDTPVPVLLLQPLLENVFKHGVERSLGQVHIRISARSENDRLIITMTNSGSSLTPWHQEGMGLRHCRERLGILYGDAASLHVANDGDGVEARLVIPLVRAPS
ncbi:sensor histidine kinase [Dyella sp.]|uniref:sensor histidine kinase n=1 Tax=Dyella sp. TaxID=1869338 RepID=UPI002ED259B6